jgi:hypothetical protein
MPEDAADTRHSFLGGAMGHRPTLLVVTYDPRRRAPAPEDDALGIMSLGCVMQSIWLIAEARIREIPAIPESVRIGFGYPATPSGGYLRVRPARM